MPKKSGASFPPKKKNKLLCREADFEIKLSKIYGFSQFSTIDFTIRCAKSPRRCGVKYEVNPVFNPILISQIWSCGQINKWMEKKEARYSVG